MIEVYILNTDEIKENEEKIISRISEARRERTERYLHSSAKRNSYGAELLLRFALKKNNAVPADYEPNIAYGKYGKPYLQDMNIHFSLSHSADYAICAVSEHPIGTDIEMLRPFKASLQRKIVSDRDILISPAELWSAKEAYLKLLGCGLCTELKLHDICVSENKIVSKNDVRQAALYRWQFNSMVVSVCSFEPQEIKKETVTTENLLSSLQIL